MYNRSLPRPVSRINPTANGNHADNVEAVNHAGFLATYALRTGKPRLLAFQARLYSDFRSGLARLNKMLAMTAAHGAANARMPVRVIVRAYPGHAPYGAAITQATQACRSLRPPRLDIDRFKLCQRLGGLDLCFERLAMVVTGRAVSHECRMQADDAFGSRYASDAVQAAPAVAKRGTERCNGFRPG